MSESKMKRIPELIKHEGQFSYSFEVTPEISEDEIMNLTVDPIFYSVTWHSKSHRCEGSNIDPIRTACFLRSINKHVLLHLSCDMLTEVSLDELLILLQEKGICNLFLVLGDGYDPATSDFKSTAQLIRYIRQKTGQYFCIGIAAFAGCSDEKLAQTKEKANCGADFMITQAFFDTDEYKTFKERCEKIGIRIPIIPGIFAFESQKQLTGFINLCKVNVSEDLLQNVENMAKLNMPCVKIAKQLIQDLIDKCRVRHFHIFTLNKLQNICKLIEQLE